MHFKHFLVLRIRSFYCVQLEHGAVPQVLDPAHSAQQHM
jgi:hypothetical protein